MSPKGDEQEGISNASLYTIMVLMMAFGSANTLVMKAQDDFVVEGYNRNGDRRQFTHPYFQCFNMFCGELCCLFVYFIKK